MYSPSGYWNFKRLQDSQPFSRLSSARVRFLSAMASVVSKSHASVCRLGSLPHLGKAKLTVRSVKRKSARQEYR